MFVWTHHKDRDYCPSIHMPRWAARVLLTVKDVRVERVQDITESDAAAEGVEPFTMTEQGVADIQISDESPELKLLAKLLGPGSFSHRFEFQLLWDGINGRRGFNWDSNPWVYVVQYELFDPTTSQQPRRFAPHCDPQLAQ